MFCRSLSARPSPTQRCSLLRPVSGVSLALLIVAAACGRSPSSPTGGSTSSTTSTVPPNSGVTGRILNGLSDQPVAGATVQIDTLGQTTSGPDGSFSFASGGAPATRSVSVTSPDTADRLTWARVPDAVLTLSLIPSGANSTAFDQMFRTNGAALRRWVETPRLVIQRRLLRFTSIGDTSYTALAATLTDQEVADLRQDLVLALGPLTGNAYQAFADVTVETANENQVVPAGTNGAIVVARVDGLKAATAFDGYTRWSWNSAGAVRMGFIMLDQAYELAGRSGRRALRAHELGHALGYNHVTAVTSVMQQVVTTEPNQFDRDASRLAFARPLLNRFPDADPQPGTTSAAVGAPATFWGGAP